jgi:hypothetical protein
VSFFHLNELGRFVLPPEDLSRAIGIILQPQAVCVYIMFCFEHTRIFKCNERGGGQITHETRKDVELESKRKKGLSHWLRFIAGENERAILSPLVLKRKKN